MRRALAALVTAALLFPSGALAVAEPGGEETFDPSHEFQLPAWVELKLGPLDMSINKAVAYLWLGSAVTILLGVGLMRWRVGVKPGTRQTIGEQIYEIAQTQVAEQGLPSRAIGRWFPYVATLMLFIWAVNMISFVPLPLTDERMTIGGLELPTFGIYAATSQISVTLALALMTFFFTHYEGIRENGPARYFKSWIPDVPKAMYPLLVPLEVLGQFMRLVSLSVRLYANLLAGHMLILTFIGLIFVIGTLWLAPFVIPVTILFYLFEVIIVVNIQAFIFAALSAIYIGSAIEPEH